jgi:biotin synthase-related radical SAM superfamily protein
VLSTSHNQAARGSTKQLAYTAKIRELATTTRELELPNNNTITICELKLQVFRMQTNGASDTMNFSPKFGCLPATYVPVEVDPKYLFT